MGLTRRGFLGATVPAAALMGLSACGGSDNAAGGSGGGGDDAIVVGFAQVGAESGWRTANTKSIQAAFEDAGIELKFSDAQQKQENQIKAIRSYIQQDVDVSRSRRSSRPAGTPCSTRPRPPASPSSSPTARSTPTDDSLYVTFLGSDFVDEGKKAGDWVVEEFADADGRSTIVQLEGTTGAAPAIDRAEGFADVIAADPKFEIVASQTGDFTRAGGKQVMEALLKSNPDIDLVYAHNDDMGLGAIEAIEAAGMVPGQGHQDRHRRRGQGRHAGARRRQDQLHRRVLTAARPAAGRHRQEGQRRRHGEKRIVTEETTFTQEQAIEALPTASTDAGTDQLRTTAGPAPTAATRPRRDADRTPDSSTTRPTRWHERRTRRRDDAASRSRSPACKALDGVDFRMFPGEVHSLMGENGAGKSTLIKALTGVYQIDAGEIAARRPSRSSFTGPAQAQAAGISTVYQEVNLLPEPLRRREHHARARAAAVRRASTGARMRRRAARAARAASTSTSTRPRCSAPTRSPCSSSSPSPAPPTSTPRCSSSTSRPRASTPTRSPSCSASSASLKDDGVAILFVSHFLDQVYEISDRLTVLRNGRLVGEYLHRRAAAHRPGAEDDRQGARHARRARASARSSRRRRRRPSRLPAGASGSAARARSSRSTSRSTRARSSASPACSARAAPSSPACSCGVDRADSGDAHASRATPGALRTPRQALKQRIAYSLGEPPQPRASSTT